MIVLMLCVCWAAVPAGCGDDDDASSGDADSDADSDSDADGDFGTCRKSCNGPSDCVPPDPNQTQTENNWSCVSGHCEFLGCQNTSECQAVFPGMQNITCNANVQPHQCTIPCTGPGDCAIPDSSLYGADNWSCTNQLCVYAGCNNDQECAAAYPNVDLGCAQYMDVPACLPTCGVPADCTDESIPAALFDEDHWLCTGGVCEHKGCATTQECQDSALFGPNFICVF